MHVCITPVQSASIVHFGQQARAIMADCAQVRALYAPLTYTVAALFMWSTYAYLGLVDLDEFLLITREHMTVQQLLAAPDCFDRCAQNSRDILLHT